MRIQTTLVVTVRIIAMAIFPCFSVMADDSPKVTIQNYVRAETDLQMRTYVENMDAFGKFAHVREAYDVTNKDTIYSWSVFDLTSPLTIGLPDPGGPLPVVDDRQSGPLDLGGIRPAGGCPR